MATATSPKSSGDRHCGYCLKFGPVQLCGKCKRQAYCSKECQAAVWKQGQGSQGHKNWCGLEYGEEDLDWEVLPVPGKSLGVIAKRSIPARYRIMVEALRSHDHPGINDLMPHNGTIGDKIKLNALGKTEDICLRMVRVNHDCDPNAGHKPDSKHQVHVLFAERVIQAGEEITISYTGVAHVLLRVKPTESRSMLIDMYGIICKDDCICHSEEKVRVIEECRNIHNHIPKQLEMLSLFSRNEAFITEALNSVNRLIELEKQINAPLNGKLRTFHQAAKMAFLKNNMTLALDYLRRCADVEESYMHPLSKERLDDEYVDDPERILALWQQRGLS